MDNIMYYERKVYEKLSDTTQIFRLFNFTTQSYVIIKLFKKCNNILYHS